MVNTKKLGNYLRKIRKEQKYSQEEAAEMAEISERTIRNLESGRTIDPELDTILKLCDVYKIPPDNIKRFFHYRFECIHPFQDGNGRVGRLLLFKECLKYNIVPFVIDEKLKIFYYRGLTEWPREKGFLTDTCLSAQDTFKTWLDYFRVPYEK